MSYIDELFEKYSTLEPYMFREGIGFCLNKKHFKQALTEALEKQREMMFDKYFNKSCQMISDRKFRLRSLMRDIIQDITDIKLEDL